MNMPNQPEEEKVEKAKQDPDAYEATPTAPGGKQTTIEPGTRHTSSGTNYPDMEKTEATPEEPGGGSAMAEGDPNQGTEAR